MKNININNGNGQNCTVKEALAAYSLDVIAEYMDDETREAVAFDLAPCTAEEFLTEYLRRAPHDLVIG